jgi:hypothetical protein
MTDDPSALKPEVARMLKRAGVCNALMGGTEAMRRAGREYLPQEPLETDRAWESRRDRTMLFPALKDAIDSMVGKPLGQPIILEDVPPAILDALEDADLAGRDLDSFARAWFRQSLADGISWALVDYPRVPEGATLQTERDMAARPYLVHIPLASVLGWKTEMRGGRRVLSQFRWREVFEEPDGEFGAKPAERVRVWEPGEVRAYAKNGGQWELDSENSGPVSIKEIPIVCFSPGRTGFFAAEPPLEELAWLNVMHWQSSSDQRHILHTARVPLKVADNKEPPRGADGREIEYGPNNILTGFENLRYLEHSGAAISAGRQDIEDIEARMSIVAGRVLTKEPGPNTSATQSALEAKDGSSKLRQWAWDFQDRLEEVLRLMAAWTGAGTGGIAKLDGSWDERPEPQMLNTILQARLSGAISAETWLYNAQRYGILQNGVTVQEELGRMESEGPEPLGGSAFPPREKPSAETA